MLAMGLLLLANLWFDVKIVWVIYGILWSFAACMSYFGEIEWIVAWQEKTSEAAQIAMWLWDAMIATCCFMKC